MLEPPIPLDETARLVSLHSLRLLDSYPEERFDRITRMAKRIFDVEICLISLVDTERQWFKSKQGLDVCETSRKVSFCGHAIFDDSVLIVPDTLLDARFVDNPLVTSAPFIRFYAGSPIRSNDGHRIGTLCLIDPVPHSLSSDEQETLRDLAAMVESEIAVSSKITIDDLTQVANRRGFNEVSTQVLALCNRNNVNAELLFFDLDNFKQINDQHGHNAGDDVLRHFAKLLVRCFRSADIVARIGGDEFAVLLAGSAQPAITAIERLRSMADSIDCEIKMKLDWSVGAVTFDAQRHKTVESLLSDADTLMYADKIARRKISA